MIVPQVALSWLTDVDRCWHVWRQQGAKTIFLCTGPRYTGLGIVTGFGGLGFYSVKWDFLDFTSILQSPKILFSWMTEKLGSVWWNYFTSVQNIIHGHSTEPPEVHKKNIFFNILCAQNNNLCEYFVSKYLSGLWRANDLCTGNKNLSTEVIILRANEQKITCIHKLSFVCTS